MDLDVRTITDDDVPAWCVALNRGFLNPGEADADSRRAGLILDRTWAGFDGDRLVSTLRTFPAELTVPGGGTLVASAVTAVTTTSTHRRRGLAARMVTAELAASAERGEPVSMLIAAEWEIYGRYGYGPATEHQTWVVDAGAARFRERPQGTVEFVDRDTARALAPAVYERHRAQRPGEMSRTDRFWDIDFGVLHYPSWPVPKPGFFVVARDPAGEPIGVARYEFEEKNEGRRATGEITTQFRIAADQRAEALLWHHLISQDLAPRVCAPDRPVDEVLPWLLVDGRHAQPVHRADFVWLRPIDVPAMLAARTYPVAGRLVLEVFDGSGLAGGRFALDGGPDGATCVRTRAAADLTLDVATLGSVYLGGHPLRTLAAAGLVDEHAAGAVARADGMFRSLVTPWCSTWF